MNDIQLVFHVILLPRFDSIFNERIFKRLNFQKSNFSNSRLDQKDMLKDYTLRMIL